MKPIQRASSFFAAALAVAPLAQAAQLTRAEAIAIYQAAYSNPPEDYVFAPQLAVGPEDLVELEIQGVVIPIAEPSWLIYADKEANADWQHQTQVFLVPCDPTHTTIAMHEGLSFLSINGDVYYNDSATFDASPDKVSGTLPQTGFPPMGDGGGGFPAGSGVGNTWGLMVSGGSEFRHQVSNPLWLADAIPEVSHWETLGLIGSPTATIEHLCDKLNLLAQMHCDKFYFVYTGHGGCAAGSGDAGLVLPNAAGNGYEVLDGAVLGAKLAQLDTDALCIVINACFAEQVLLDAAAPLGGAGFPSEGIAGTCKDKPGMASDLYSVFAFAYHYCKDNPIPGLSLKECINQAMAGLDSSWYPQCYTDWGTDPPVAGTMPQKAKCLPAECYLIAGLSPAWFALGGGDVLLLAAQLPVAIFPVSTEVIPDFAIPNDASLLGVHAYFQVFMWNPWSYPDDARKLSNGVDVQVGGAAAEYGPESGMHLWASGGSAPLGGTLELQFTIGS